MLTFFATRPTRVVMIAAFAAALTAAGCSSPRAIAPGPTTAPAQIASMTQAGRRLAELPPPAMPVSVAVYGFEDLTGSRRPNEDFAEFSTAVTQGAGEYLADALYRAGAGQWFEVVERSGIQSLLTERQLIRQTREQFEGPNATALPPLRFAGIIIQGGVVAYDSNVETGGVGARYLGVGGSTEYRRDQVTVVMRAVSVQTGAVLASVSTTKTIYSRLVDGGAFTFVAFDELLELEAGYSTNEAPQLAVQQAIELGVYALVLEGVHQRIWSFSDPSANALVDEYLQVKNSSMALDGAEPSRDGADGGLPLLPRWRRRG